MDKILLDLDGVLGNTPKAILHWAKEYLKIDHNLTPRDLVTYNSEQSVGITEEKLHKLFYLPEFWRSIPTFIGTWKFISFLRSNFSHPCELHVVTDRRWYPELEKETAAWLRMHDIKPDIVKICKGKEKHLYAREAGINLAIEDNVNNARLLAEVCPVILMEWPYNRFEDIPDEVHNAENYSQACELINAVLWKAKTYPQEQSTIKLYKQ